ncbi:hypothetical protein BH23ACT4_BH23ACT4_09550 [soil metagenome]
MRITTPSTFATGPESASERHAARRPRFPWRIVLVLVGALLFGGFLNGRSLLDTASSLEPGWQRNIGMAAAHLLVDIGATLHLDCPHVIIDRELGRVSPTTPPAPIPDPAFATTTTAPATTTQPQNTATTSPTTTTILTTTTLHGVFTPTPDTPARIWVAGDSLTERFGPSLVNLLADTGVVEMRHDVKYSTGLTRPDFFDWPLYLDQELTENRTDILVFMIGANDGQPIQTSAGWIQFGTDEWVGEYRQRVAQTMDLLTDQVPTVYWIGQPIARSAEYSAKMALMDDIFRSEASQHPSITYVDTWALFSDANGAYSAYLPDSSSAEALVRSGDGIHLTVEGGDRLAARVRDVIAVDWPLPYGEE